VTRMSLPERLDDLADLTGFPQLPERFDND
jgi:hypothetical protein